MHFFDLLSQKELLTKLLEVQRIVQIKNPLNKYSYKILLTRKQDCIILGSEETRNERGGEILNNKLLNQFKEYLEKQDILNKLTESQNLNDFGYSEIHTITAIGDLEKPNVTEIAKELKMTRGAISKITKKLISKGLIESFEIPENKQKVFFKLTDTGKVLYSEHDKRHNEWEERDLQFMNKFSTEQLETISLFMTSYNTYLASRIKNIEENSNE